MEIHWTDEERIAMVDVTDNVDVPWWAMSAIANKAVSLFLARASGQVKEDKQAVRSVLDHACANGGELTGRPCRACAVETGALFRLSALAQGSEQAYQRGRDDERSHSRATSVHSSRATGTDGIEAARSHIAEALGIAGEGLNRHGDLSMLASRAQEAEALRAKVAELENEGRAADAASHVTRTMIAALEKERDAARAEAETLRRNLADAQKDVAANVAEAEKWKAEHAAMVIQAKDARHMQYQAQAEAERLEAMIVMRNSLLRAKTEALTSAESRLASIRERATSDMTEEKAATVRWVLEGDAPQEVKVCSHPEWVVPPGGGGGFVCMHCKAPIPMELQIEAANHAMSPSPRRYPCSPTCTHDDAAKMGHPERVRLLSGEVAKVAGLEGTVTDELRPIVLKNGTTVAPDDAPDMDAARRMFEAERAKVTERIRQKSAEVMAMAGGVVGRDDDVMASLHADAAIGRGSQRLQEIAYDKGAEAMRAACWEAAQEALEPYFPRAGWQLLWETLKAAIEGATP